MTPFFSLLRQKGIPRCECGGVIKPNVVLYGEPLEKYVCIGARREITNEISWKQGAGIKTGDIVFMYIGSPVSAILYQCVVTKTDIPWHYEREGLTIKSLMNIRLLKQYDPDKFTFEVLNQKYGIFAVRGPRGVPHSLSEALSE